MSEPGKLIAGGAIAQLRLVAEREQGLLAAGRLSGPRDGKHLVEGQIRALVPARRMRKRAVMANVAAKLRQRNENLARIRDDRTVRGIAPAGGCAQQWVQIAVHERQRFRAGEIAVVAEIDGQLRTHRFVQAFKDWRRANGSWAWHCRRASMSSMARNARLRVVDRRERKAARSSGRSMSSPASSD